VPTVEVLAAALDSLSRVRGKEAITRLMQLLRRAGVPRHEHIQVRCALADAWLLEGDVARAGEVLGRQPDARERLDPARLSLLWLTHGRLAVAAGEPSRGIALFTKALAQAERAHDSRAIGLARYELGRAYRLVGDTGTVREHIAQAALALHAAGDLRHLALVHSLSGVTLAEEGRLDDAMNALRKAERMAVLAGAGDVIAIICGNQANVALMQHHHDQALTLAERSVDLQRENGTPHGLGVALASLGQIYVRLGKLARAEDVLTRALEARSPLPVMRETTGAVFDTLAQIHLIRGDYEAAGACIQQAREAYGTREGHAAAWYQWSLHVLEGRLALRQGQFGPAVVLGSDLTRAPGVPPTYALQGELIVVEALLGSGLVDNASDHLESIASRIQPSSMSGTWGEFLRLRGKIYAASGRGVDAYHDFAQSVSVFDLLGERYQAAISHLEMGRLAAGGGAVDRARRYLTEAAGILESLAARPDLEDARAVLASLPAESAFGRTPAALDPEDGVVRRLVDAAFLPPLLGREAAAGLLEACDAEAVVLYVERPDGRPEILAHAGCSGDEAERLATRAGRDTSRTIAVEPVGREGEHGRFAAICTPRPLPAATLRRVRTLAAVVRLGYDLCAARERSGEVQGVAPEPALEPLLPGFICASAAMRRVVDQIQRLQGSDLTVLITGESGTGKDLVARAIHAGSPRRGSMFLPYNCTSATRELADSQLFGHRRGAFTGAIADQPGVLRTAVGGTLFLDEVGDLPLDVQPKLLRFLEQGEVLPVGDTRPQRVDVRVVAATNADLEQRVADGKFREDLFYRLSVIRIVVPPLRERREEIPHLSMSFLREASDRLGKPGVHLSPETLDLFDAFDWPGNVRQLRNEVQRAVALAPPNGLITPDLLSPPFSAMLDDAATPARVRVQRVTLAAAVNRLEREMIEAALETTRGNISETARTLGLTRRGLYLKMERLRVRTPHSV
jgi:DNA-binding NtrC family response regulator/tetratricopeptide (TPR) repeat protein